MSGTGRRALLLDDEAERRVAMRDGLLDHGVESEGVATLEEAIRRLAVSRYDLVVCDLVLCDPPWAPNPSFRGYLAVCFALHRQAGVVVQASSLRRLAHPGTVLTNWSVPEVADVLYGSSGIPIYPSTHGGCPWPALRRCAAAAPERRPDVVRELAQLPIVRALETSTAIGEVLGRLEDAAGGVGEWAPAMAAAWGALFPGATDAA